MSFLESFARVAVSAVDGSITIITNTGSTADLTSYTESGVAYGSGIVAVCAIGVAVGARTIDSITIDGNPMVEQVTTGSSIKPGSIYTFDTTGITTSGDIVTTFSAGCVRFVMAVYRMNDISSITATDTDNTVSTDNDNSGSIAIDAGGVGLAYAFSDGVAYTGCTGLTFDSNSGDFESANGGAASGAFATAQSPLAFDFSPDTGGSEKFYVSAAFV